MGIETQHKERRVKANTGQGNIEIRGKVKVNMNKSENIKQGKSGRGKQRLYEVGCDED